MYSINEKVLNENKFNFNEKCCEIKNDDCFHLNVSNNFSNNCEFNSWVDHKNFSSKNVNFQSDFYSMNGEF